MKSLLKNPFAIWLKRLSYSMLLIFFNRFKKLKLGNNVSVTKSTFGFHNYIYDNCSISNALFGDFTYVAPNANITRAKVGSFCSIGPECRIGLGKHPTTDFISTHPIFFSSLKQCGTTFSDGDYFEEFGDIEIGHDVWLASRVTIVDGVKIGNGAIIASGAVVTKDVPDYAIVGGVPAKLIRYRFDEDQIKFLQESKWWELDGRFLKENFKSMHNFVDFKKLILSSRNNKSQ